MIMTYDMSAGTFESVPEHDNTDNADPNHTATELYYRNLELQLVEIPHEASPVQITLTPELAAMDSEAFLALMKK
jgi:hypothetical protein